MGAVQERNQTQTSPLNAKAKSKRDLMEDVLQKGSKSDYIPAGFFMHFNKKGDEAVKAHMNYFKATQMDFVKIQFD
jgi:uroporphyrinogen decarboxylase